MQPVTAIDDHRTRVGAARRERTRMHLVETALGVFAAKGPDNPVIDDFIAAANVARGTFYNYFRTTGDLLLAVATDLSTAVLSMVDPVVLRFDDPAERIGCGTRLVMRVAQRYPAYGAFVARVGLQRGARGKLIDTYLMRDLEAGYASGRFRTGNVAVARDVILGSIVYGIGSMQTGVVTPDHPELTVRMFLEGLGLTAPEAARIAAIELPPALPPEGSILARLEAAQSVPKARRGAVRT